MYPSIQLSSVLVFFEMFWSCWYLTFISFLHIGNLHLNFIVLSFYYFDWRLVKMGKFDVKKPLVHFNGCQLHFHESSMNFIFQSNVLWVQFVDLSFIFGFSSVARKCKIMVKVSITIYPFKERNIGLTFLNHIPSHISWNYH